MKTPQFLKDATGKFTRSHRVPSTTVEAAEKLVTAAGSHLQDAANSLAAAAAKHQEAQQLLQQAKRPAAVKAQAAKPTGMAPVSAVASAPVMRETALNNGSSFSVPAL